MKIAFDLKAQISVPDADFAPEKDKLEKMLIERLGDEGVYVRNLSVENYTVEGEE